jgi:hypothetical protein
MTARLEVGWDDDLKRSLSSGLRLMLPGSSRDIVDSILGWLESGGGGSPRFGVELSRSGEHRGTPRYFG